MVELLYATEAMARICTDRRALDEALSQDAAHDLRLRLAELRASHRVSNVLAGPGFWERLSEDDAAGDEAAALEPGTLWSTWLGAEGCLVVRGDPDAAVAEVADVMDPNGIPDREASATAAAPPTRLGNELDLGLVWSPRGEWPPTRPVTPRSDDDPAWASAASPTEPTGPTQSPLDQTNPWWAEDEPPPDPQSFEDDAGAQTSWPVSPSRLSPADPQVYDPPAYDTDPYAAPYSDIGQPEEVVGQSYGMVGLPYEAIGTAPSAPPVRRRQARPADSYEAVATTGPLTPPSASYAAPAGRGAPPSASYGAPAGRGAPPIQAYAPPAGPGTPPSASFGAPAGRGAPLDPDWMWSGTAELGDTAVPPPRSRYSTRQRVPRFDPSLEADRD
jgi:hypothetical protein